jgi:hypothetical protein
VRRKRIHAGLIVAAVMPLVFVLSGAGAAVLMGRDDSAGSTGGSGIATRGVARASTLDNGISVLGDPGGEWSVRADQLVPGGSFDQMHFWEGADGAEVLSFPTALVVHVSSENSYMFVGLDPVDGHALWKRNVPSESSSCYAVAENTRMLCSVSSDGSGKPGSYELVDPRSGKTLGRYAAGVGDEGIASDRDWIYLATLAPGTDYLDHSTVVAKLSADNLSRKWVAKGVDPGPDKDQGDDFDAGIFVTQDSGTVNISYGYLDWSFEATQGKQSAFSDIYEDGYTRLAAGYRVTDDYVDEKAVTRVEDSTGNSILDVDGAAWSPEDFTAPVVNNGRIGIGPSLYDLSTGEKVWSREDLTPAVDEDGASGDLGVRWSPQGDQLVLTAGDGSEEGEVSTLVDAGDGKTVWQRSSTSSQNPAAWTPDGFITVDGTDLVTSSRTAEAPAWQRPLDELTSESERPTFAIGVTDESVAAVGDTAIRGFTDFPADAGNSNAGGGDEKGDAGTDYVTACGSEPEFTPVESEAANGGVTVTFEVHAVCPGGGWLNATGQRVTLTGPSGVVFADAAFDFSDTPFWIPGPDDRGVTIRLTFAYDTVFSTSTELNEGIADDVVVVECEKEPGSSDGTIPTDPDFGADISEPVQADGPPQGADADEDALAALRRIAEADTGPASDLEGSWMPQLSSKRRGTTDDGIVYSYRDILAEHLRLRERYPDVRLVNSDDFGSFLVPGYWVTLVGSPSAGWRPALQWCPDHGFDKDHCYAKRLLRDGPSDGAAKHLDALNP